MKRFLKTRLFLLLQEASQRGIDADAQVLDNEYDEFALLLFTENVAFKSKVTYCNTLIYTSIEFENLTLVSGKKCNNLSAKSP
jgi:hypothetical protein